ncbi:RidA family protein [Mesorhizobium sp. IMUNJ 23232]|uniref:RidA family protein n=1 Tax=Mesorhizobium sp. IMUNJ 23232 TaxID=3376064 RepID=UPI0037BB8224
MADGAYHPLKTRPRGATQHVTAGPYSPVLEVDATKLVVISGQVAIDMDGAVLGETIEEQTRATLGNCARQLASADCSLADVFKVNIYLTDLGQWSRFNAVYDTMMPEPLPVRTAVQAVLLPGFLVEIEMWAVKARD